MWWEPERSAYLLSQMQGGHKSARRGRNLETALDLRNRISAGSATAELWPSCGPTGSPAAFVPREEAARVRS